MYSVILATALTGFAVVNAAPPLTGFIVPGTTGALGDAAVVDGNPVGVTYTATLPNITTSDIRGFIAGTSNANGTGVFFNINLSGLPDASLGPFCKSSALHIQVCIATIQRLISLPCSVPYPRPAGADERELHCNPSPSGSIRSRREASMRPYRAGDVPDR